MSHALPFPLPLGPGVRVLTAAETGLVALEKPEGVLSHPNAGETSRNTLIAAPYDERRECYLIPDTDGPTRPVWLLNRLDSPTSGVVLISLREDTATAVKTLFAEREIDKTYHAVVKGGRLVPASGTWRDRLDKKHGAGHVRAVAGSGAEAVSHYAWLRTNRELPALSLIRLEPKTGRTHQLRIQCSAHGHPIAGDKTYGDFGMNKALAARNRSLDRLFLHCSRTAFRYTLGGRIHDFLAESPLPPEFAKLVPETAAAAPVSERLSIRVNRPTPR